MGDRLVRVLVLVEVADKAGSIDYSSTQLRIPPGMRDTTAARAVGDTAKLLYSKALGVTIPTPPSEGGR